MSKECKSIAAINTYHLEGMYYGGLSDTAEYIFSNNKRLDEYSVLDGFEKFYFCPFCGYKL
jgi:hypothetical protein